MITTMTMAGSVCFGNNDDGDDNLDKGDDYDNEIVIMVMHDFLTVPPDFQYQNVYVEENPPSSFDSTLTVNYRLITCQPSPPNHNNYDIITIMIISTTNEI